MYSNTTRFNAHVLSIASQYILHSSQITFSIFCYLFLLASHVPLCHNLFCPLVYLPFSPQISLYSDKSGFLWGLYSVDSAAGLYNMFCQRKQRITDQCTKGAGQCVYYNRWTHTALWDQYVEWVTTCHYLHSY